MRLPANSTDSQRVLILAPLGRDGKLIRGELETAGFQAEICATVQDLCAEMERSAGCALIAEEALKADAVALLSEAVARQPPWSDFPLLIMTWTGPTSAGSKTRLSTIAPLGNVSLLDRPMRPVTLVSAMLAALRARARQYQLRDHLTRLKTSEQALRESEARFRFLSELAEATRSATKPEAVTEVVARCLGEHLHASRCAYATVDPETHDFEILHDFTQPGLPSSVGHYRLPEFGTYSHDALRAGRTLVLRDVAREVPPGDGHESFESLRIGALICCPLIKGGKLVALMAVHQSEPRNWTHDEIELVQEVVERCWAYIERERLMVELAGNLEKLHRTNRDLSRVNRELEEFAYVASHDLQEPLRMVKIYTQLILNEIDRTDHTVDHYADFVQQGANRMEELIRDLLSFSRAVHSESPTVGVADLGESLSEAISVLKSRITENAATIRFGPLPRVSGDTRQLAHVFQNLISNSVKYRKTTQAPAIDIRSSLADGRWTIAVTDNGIGFEPVYAERIFGLFKRLHKDEYPGTGLGLAICQRIVERYGGQMWAEGEPGKGSTFYFTLPAAAAA